MTCLNRPWSWVKQFIYLKREKQHLIHRNIIMMPIKHRNERTRQRKLPLIPETNRWSFSNYQNSDSNKKNESSTSNSVSLPALVYRLICQWSAAKKLFRLWKSQRITKAQKRKFFQCMIMPILIYSCESWALDPTLLQKLHANLTRLLRFALNVHWSTHTRNSALYDHIPCKSDTLRYRRVKFAGHAIRADDQPVSSLLFQPDPQRANPALTFQSLLIDDLTWL